LSLSCSKLLSFVIIKPQIYSSFPLLALPQSHKLLASWNTPSIHPFSLLLPLFHTGIFKIESLTVSERPLLTTPSKAALLTFFPLPF
jgi:hypothetical protein